MPEALSVRLEAGGVPQCLAQLDHIAGILQAPYRLTFDVESAAQLPVKLVFYDRRTGEAVAENEIDAEVGKAVDIYGKPGDRCFFWE